MILDTCVLLWMAVDPAKLSLTAKSVLVKNGMFYVSAISAFEIAIKHKKKKLKLPELPWQWFQETTEALNIKEIPISAKIAALSTQVAVVHNDPADRIIVATAIEHNMPVITSDHLIRDCNQINTIW